MNDAIAAADVPESLGYAQLRFWWLSHYQTESAMYNVPVALALTGHLDKSLLQKSLDAVVKRHSMLRTTFPSVDDIPCQRVQPVASLPIELIRWSGQDLDAEHPSVQARLTEIASQAFDLAGQWPLRVVLLELGVNRHVLLLVAHHIAIDGWSMQTLQRDLWALYRSGLSGESTQLPDLMTSYPEFVRWQSDWLVGDALNTRLQFWTSRLQDADQGLPLPTDRPRPAQRSGRGGIIKSMMPDATAKAVRELAGAQEATPFMVLLSAFYLLLFRLSGHQDICIGTPVSNRSRLPRRWRKATRDMVGLFMNTLVLREQLEPDMSFSELVDRVRASTIAALMHQDLPMEKLVEELHPERSLASNPLFQILFSVEEFSSHEPQLPELQGQSLVVHTGTAKFDLSLTLTEVPGQTHIVAEYSQDLFDQDTVERLVTYYKRILAEVTRSPDLALSSVSIMSQEQRQDILVAWNNTALDYPRDVCIDALFSNRSRVLPDAVAVVWDKGKLSYAQLNAKSDQLANYLHSLGAGPETLVGVCLPRTGELLVALLAILKVGAAWLPLAANYPKQRLELMLQDSGADFILTDSDQLQLLPESAAVVICLDTAPWHHSAVIVHRDRLRRDAGSRAYLMYTSGSTGVPKGVMVSHRSVVALSYWAQSHYSSGELNGVLAGTSLSFDLSVFELMVTLLCGGTVVLAEDVLGLTEANTHYPVTLINSVPSAIEELLEHVDLPDTVITVNVCGEPLKQELVEALYRQRAVKQVYDLYGPTETTVYSTCALRRAGEPATIGRPISNTRVYVLDEHKNPLPPGVPGELYIGGDGVALGYLGRPDLNCTKFVDDPYTEWPGARLYRTGDQVRYRVDGNLEFLGRLDDQIKLRGFRVEPGEISALLRNHQDVRDAVVLLQEDSVGEKRLVAFLVANEAMQPGGTILRDYLAAKLPEFMVPSVFVRLESLPRLPNGKLDRGALLLSQSSLPERDFIPPRSPMEKDVSKIWQEVLGQESIGIEENFFDLGGHSLLALQIIGRLNRRFSAELSLPDLFKYPTINGLCACMNVEEWELGML